MQYPTSDRFPVQSESFSPYLRSLLTALTHAVESKDSCTSGHIKRTAHYAVRIAAELPGMSETVLERVHWAALLHDVGKLGIGDSILKKDAPLEEFEWERMREHPMLGYEILGSVSGLEDIAEAICFHHERWDGQGYPHRLEGDAIPWLARLISVADAYDAMISTRPYRKAMSHAYARQEILSGSGTQFDPQIVEAFARAFVAPLAKAKPHERLFDGAPASIT